MEDAFVVGFEEDSHAVDYVVGGLEVGLVGGGLEDVGAAPGYGFGPGWGCGVGGDGGPGGFAGAAVGSLVLAIWTG